LNIAVSGLRAPELRFRKLFSDFDNGAAQRRGLIFNALQSRRPDLRWSANARGRGVLRPYLRDLLFMDLAIRSTSSLTLRRTDRSVISA
jgi:hypothetical protein